MNKKQGILNLKFRSLRELFFIVPTKWWETMKIHNDISWSKIPKASPQQNCHIERFNRTAREDLFDANMFTSLEHALELTHEFMTEYNYRRPHESLKMLTPNEYAA